MPTIFKSYHQCCSVLHGGANESNVAVAQPKGADRKQKTDREKMEKRAPQEREKYQSSYETTILTEVSIATVWAGGWP